jgi:hypothetical protein
MSFDGHKGRGLEFQPSGLLKQPLYKLNAENTRVTEELYEEEVPFCIL